MTKGYDRGFEKDNISRFNTYALCESKEEETEKEEVDELNIINYIKNSKKAVINMCKIFNVQSPTGKEYGMKTFLMKALANMGLRFKIDSTGNIMVTKGKLGKNNFYPCIVAHMDKVHNFTKGYNVVTGLVDTGHGTNKSEKEAIWAKSWNIKTLKEIEWGGCGDDGAGIYVALEALKHINIIKAVFFVEEESGCVGSSKVDLTFFNDCGYIIEGDRRGSSDLILNVGSTDVCSKEFKDAAAPIFKHYGFKKAFGSTTDVMKLAKRNVDISVMNFSVGYYDAHLNSEYTVISELINSTEFALNLIKYLGNVKYAYEYKNYTPTTYYNSYGDNYLMSNNKTKGGLYKNINNGRNTSHCLRDGFNKNWLNDGTIKDNETCTCADTYLHLKAVDLDCKFCNPFIIKTEASCECGQFLSEHLLSYHCSICGQKYIKMT